MAKRRPNPFEANYDALQRLQETTVPDNELGEVWKLASQAIDDEPQSIALIKRYLLTEDQRLRMFQHNFSIEDLLNGRIEGEERQAVGDQIETEWNRKLGYKAFFSGEDPEANRSTSTL